MSNMKLWQEVCVTDPAAVKPITGKSYKGNSPKPYWIIQRATEVFGPVGIGWGVTVKSERFERLSEHDVLHVAVVSVWFVRDGKRSETFDQMGGTKACYMTGKGSLMVDEDAGKKSVTDGMVKCLSMIGFAGDIFSGMWDDSKYVEWAAEETTRRNTATMPENLVTDWITFINDSSTVGELKARAADAEEAAAADPVALAKIQAAVLAKKAKAKKQTEPA